MEANPYRGRLRVRINGLLIRNGALLLVKLKSPVLQRDVWMPPGGGLQYGESMKECLVREFREETGMVVNIGTLLHVNELIKASYHAVEFYFEVEETGGEPVLGVDPEQAGEEQILQDIRFIPINNFSDFEIVPTYLKEDFQKEFKTGKFGFTSSLRKQ